MKEVKVRFFFSDPHETILILPTEVDIALSHTAMVIAEKQFALTLHLLKARKLFVQRDSLSTFGRYDFLPDITSHSPLMRLPHILGSIFGLYVIPMPEMCKDDFEWIVTDMEEDWGVASHKAL
ncbi:hypothetical protein LCGC14_2758730 [marine sediment metagenome]|uniref:Uncharacterized protein n=1 Tax=marine sediment metagenome TaxID=412755 RepID=A0A0F9B891_9ZZZZ